VKPEVLFEVENALLLISAPSGLSTEPNPGCFMASKKLPVFIMPEPEPSGWPVDTAAFEPSAPARIFNFGSEGL